MAADVSIRISGPVFDGRAARILRDAGRAAQAEIAEMTKAEVEVGTNVFRYESKPPTGRYRRGIHLVNLADLIVVRPARLPYIRWIEGTSSRNATTRFKGYKVFQQARLRAEAKARAITDKHLIAAVRRLG